MNGAAPLTYGGRQMRSRRGAICLIALLVASPNQESNQERGASKQLAPQSPHAIANRSKLGEELVIVLEKPLRWKSA